MTAWISKHALTNRGIYAVEGDVQPGQYKWFRDRAGKIYGKTEWHATEKAAHARAMQMHYEHVERLKTQLRRLQRRLRLQRWDL